MYPLGDQDTSAAPACVVVMDADRRLIQASPGARRMLASCPALRLVHGVVCASTNAVGARLAAAVRALVSGEAFERSLWIDECGIDVTMTMVEGVTGMRQIVATLRQFAQSRALHLGRAVEEYGLTPAEARLLDVLCTGVSVPQAAARLGVARTTARTHLQRIFDKSGARRQSDLQRLVFAPSPFAAT